MRLRTALPQICYEFPWVRDIWRQTRNTQKSVFSWQTLNFLSIDPLVSALREFQATLTPQQKADLIALKGTPDATAVITFTAEVDKKNAERRSRCVASRVYDVLQSVQQFSLVVDTFAQSHADIAALVWGSVKLTILVCPSPRFIASLIVSQVCK